MLTVKTSIKPSKTHGIGLFAREDIKKDTITWKYNPRFDLAFTPEEVSVMDSRERELISWYGFLSRASGQYIYPSDNSRFTNHSLENNIAAIVLPGETEFSGIALKNIKKGEELLLDYRTFDAHDTRDKELYVKES